MSFLLSIGILFLIIHWAGGFSAVWNTILLIPYYMLLLVCAIYGLGWFLRGLRWKLLLKNLGIKISIINSAELIFIGNTYNLVLPAKLGDTARIVGLKKVAPSSIPTNVSSVVTDRFLDFGAVIVLTFISLPFLKLNQISQNVQILLYVSPSLLLIGILLYLYLYIKREDAFLLKILPKKFQNIICDLIEGLALSVEKKLFVQIIISLSIWVLDTIIAFLLYISIQSVDFSIFIVIIFGVMIGNLTKTLPITPGGIGTYELAFASILTLVGVPIQISVSIALLDHLVKNLFTLFFGSISSIHLGFFKQTIHTKKNTELMNNE